MVSAKRLRERYVALKRHRSTYDNHWDEIAEYVLPRHVRLSTSDTNVGSKMNEKIVNGTATRSLRILGAGMMAGITSPARRWFRLTTPDPKKIEHPGVRGWLEELESRMLTVCARSNAYNAFAMLYEVLPCFGTGPLLVEEDVDDVIRVHNIPVGSYVLGTDAAGRVTTLMYIVPLTVEQFVQRFGLDMASDSVKQYARNKQWDERIDVVHAIMPNEEQLIGVMGPPGMAYASYWFEERSQEDKFLKIGGYEECPFMAPRWDVIGNDVYGSCPGMDALGDVKALQLLERKKLLAMNKIVNPPMKGPSSLRTARPSILPGDMTYVDAVGQGSQFEPAHLVDPRALMVNEVIAEHERRISGFFYADLFLIMTQRPYTKTAREVDELHEEKMLQLGPVLERLQDEFLDPFIDRLFGVMFRRGLVPTIPSSLDEGEDLRVEYISILSQAQKMLGTVSIERLIGFVTSSSQFVPEVLDKVDWDQTVDKLGDLLGVPSSIVRSDDDVDEVRKARQQAQAAQQAAQMAPAMKQAAEAAAIAKEAKLGDAEGLDDVIRTTTGVEP